jgi:hypothetical protein
MIGCGIGVHISCERSWVGSVLILAVDVVKRDICLTGRKVGAIALQSADYLELPQKEKDDMREDVIKALKGSGTTFALSIENDNFVLFAHQSLNSAGEYLQSWTGFC